MTKIRNQLPVEETSLNLVQGVHKNPRVRPPLVVKRRSFPTGDRDQHNYCSHPHLHLLEALAKEGGKNRK